MLLSMYTLPIRPASHLSSPDFRIRPPLDQVPEFPPLRVSLTVRPHRGPGWPPCGTHHAYRLALSTPFLWRPPFGPVQPSSIWPCQPRRQGCLWGGPPAHPIRPIDLRARPVRVKRALTNGHGKSDLPCPRWLPPRPPRRRTSGRRRVAGHGCNGVYRMSGADPMGDNGKASADGKNGWARTPMAQTGIWAWTEVAGTGMWARTFRAGTGMWARTLRWV
jgi:hypothetical protein